MDPFTSPLRLVQFLDEEGTRRVAKVDAGGSQGSQLQILANTTRIYDLALEAGRTGATLEEIVGSRLRGEWVEYDPIITTRRLLPPLDHPDLAHCLVTGTGLTHLGSAQARDAMHTKVVADAPLTDSMRLFQWGLEGGKPPKGEISVQSEWFYKGNGYNVVPPEQPLVSPSFALDGGEEAELVGLYVISELGEVLRVGFALGNEFSDHVMEAKNYLYLAHSKLRTCSFGPEIIIGPLPAEISGQVRIERDGQTLWEAPFLTGEERMSYTISNLEHHHFKYELFRKPGDVHCHFFGTATLSRNAGIVTQPGDRFEISAPGFGRPLRNTLQQAPDDHKVFKVRSL
ncbi:MAG TPA: AraD1 family protein [Anaerolineales bacterium]|nr:AraD1 family protein [Anaerolineales bacterium]